MGRLTSIIDEIKKQTKITEQFITTAHTGRAKLAEGDERARGATALDDWVDSRMVLTREGENRFLFAEGRGKVAMLETKLIFDPATNLSLMGEGDRKTTREVEHVNVVVEIVTGSPGMNTRSLTEAVRERIPSHNQDHQQGDRHREEAGARPHSRRQEQREAVLSRPRPCLGSTTTVG